jgi:hypothetical protein
MILVTLVLGAAQMKKAFAPLKRTHENYIFNEDASVAYRRI